MPDRRSSRTRAPWLIAAAAALLLGTAPVAVADQLTGVWHGTGTQSPPGRDPEWTIVMTIGDQDGSIDYPSLSCGGTLTQLSRDAKSAQFRETITYGKERCIDGGTVSVSVLNGNLSWSWVGSSRGTQFTANAKVIATLMPREPPGAAAR